VRRVHELQAATELLESLGVPARVGRASRDWLQDLTGTVSQRRNDSLL
jgi:hypothetical protein